MYICKSIKKLNISADVKAFVKVNAKPTVKNGLEYLKLVDLSVKVKIGNGNISLKDEKYYALGK